MKKIIFSLIAISFFITSCNSTKTLELQETVQKEVHLKIHENDGESKLLNSRFQPLERYLYDSQGREIYYDDLSDGAWFGDVSDSFRQSTLASGERRDLKRRAEYDKEGRLLYSLKENRILNNELIRKYNSNGKLVYAKGDIDKLSDQINNYQDYEIRNFTLEIWLDDKGNILHLTDETGRDQRWEYDSQSHIIHSWDESDCDFTNEYDSSGNCTYIYNKIPDYDKYDYESPLIYSVKNEFSPEGLLLCTMDDYTFYEDKNFEKVDYRVTSVEEYSYDSNGRLLSDIYAESYTKRGELNLVSKITYKYSEDGRTVFRRTEDSYYSDPEHKNFVYSDWYEEEDVKDSQGRLIRSYSNNHILWDEDDLDSYQDYETEETYSYDEDGTTHWKNLNGEEKIISPSGNLIFHKENYYENEWSEETYNDNDREERIYSKNYKIKDDGSIEMDYESWHEFDSEGRETLYKYLSYTEKRHPQEETYHTFDKDGRLLYQKKFDAYYTDPVTNLYSPVRREIVKESFYTYDEHGNELTALSYENGKKNDYSWKSSYTYDEEGRITYEFHGIYYQDKLNENSEGWYEYDKNNFLTYKKVKAYSDGTFGTYKPEKVPTFEYFFINQYTYYKNGQIKDCIRYYYKNEFYERDWQPDLLRQK
ncbi:hypothetical protein [Treponema sp.]|uniref:hypothetical protein n=1 Tax=Treponema sp. TaxID=166 RepID=UPI002600AF8B|nr:hypothetical protein [Treponema sp.]MCR5217879.1 hypothetical protein [Treponema sp.]